MPPEKKVHLKRPVLNFSAGPRFVTPLLIAATVGAGTGLIAILFIKLLGTATVFFFGQGAETLGFMGSYYVILIPVLGGLVVGPIVTIFAPEAKGHGVPEVLRAIALRGGRIRPVVVVIKAVASILTIGAGFSVGREGPIVQVGSALGSTIGQRLKLSEGRIKNLVACGAAAGIAAVFNAPIAGVMFASEVILRDFTASTLSTVVVSAVCASIISRMSLGDSPAFKVPTYVLQSPWEIALYLGLGAVAALVGVLFITTLRKSEEFWDNLRIPEWVKPAAGGVIIGLLGLFFPRLFGIGFDTIESSLAGTLPLAILLALILLKTGATAISLGCGTSGGVFAPTLFIGAVLGGAFGVIASRLFSFPMEASGAYALVGMACVFAAGAHAPVTGILIVFEMTNDYRLILPLMVAVVTATSLSQLLHRESMYTDRLKQRGIDIGFMEEVKMWGGLLVRDAMSSAFELIPSGLPAKELLARSAVHREKALFTVDEKGRLAGSIDSADIENLLTEEDIRMIIAEDLAVTIGEFCYPEDSLIETARAMTARHLSCVPVVDARDSYKVVGVLRLEDILQRYSNESLRRTDIMHQTGYGALSASRVATTSFLVSTRSPMAGRHICDLHLPDGVRFSYIRRGTQYILPRGELALQRRDRVWVVFLPEHQDTFRQWLHQQRNGE